MAEQEEISLDPQDWESFRRLAHEALDEAINFLQAVRERAVWLPVPEEIRDGLREPLPLVEAPIEAVFAEFKEKILPYATGNIHPRFFGWVHGAGQPGNIVAEMMAAAMNSNCGGRNHGAIYVEQQVVNWCKELFEFPVESSGLLVSGTSMANLIALGVARNAWHENVRGEGLGTTADRLAVYASREAHDSVVKALEILGLGSASLRKVDVDGGFAVDIDALRHAIVKDRACGWKPFCVVGCAGTVNTGAMDDLNALADLCAEEKIWFHVDGAFGGLCAVSERLKDRVHGIERADSIAFDFHKWAHVQYDAAVVLVRRAELQLAAYSMRPAYLKHQARGLGGGDVWPCDLGLELSRSFRALKVWFALKQHGIRKLGALIEQNCDQAQFLARRVEREPELELLAPVTLNIVCFRVRAEGMDADAVNRLNEEIVADVQESGVAAPSTSSVHGKLAIRVNITNHRTRLSDMDLLVDAILGAARSRLTAKTL